MDHHDQPCDTSRPMRRRGLRVAAALSLPLLQGGIAQAQTTAEQVVNTSTAGHQTAADVAANAQGSSVVVWSGPDGDGSGIFARRYLPDGSAAGPEFRVNPDPGGAQTEPAVAIDGSGRFIVVYVAADDDGSGIYARRYAANGAALDSRPIRVNRSTAESQREPDVAANAAGVTVIAWREEIAASGAPRIEFRRYAASGSALGDDVLVSQERSSDDVLRSPSVAVQPDGSFAIAYEDSFPGDEFGITPVACYSANGSLIEAEAAFLPGFFPSLSVAGAGYVLASDDSIFDSDDDYLMLAVLDRSGQVIAAPRRVSEIAAGNAGQAAVAGDAAGRIAVAGTVAQDGAGTIHGRQFNLALEPRSPFTRLSSAGSRPRSGSAVAITGNGTVIAVWTDGAPGDHGLDGDQGGIVLRRFAAAR